MLSAWPSFGLSALPGAGDELELAAAGPNDPSKEVAGAAAMWWLWRGSLARKTIIQVSVIRGGSKTVQDQLLCCQRQSLPICLGMSSWNHSRQ